MSRRAPARFGPLAHGCVAALRGLAIDCIERAKSGHPGLPLGAAPMAYVLWRHHLRVCPSDPHWPNRDRFVLSAGHGSALLYALLHLCGFDLTQADLRAFRHGPGRTPGHPERGQTAGVEISTGPLGQGAAASVGMALAERLAAQRFNRRGHPVVDHRTYSLLSDGDLHEGVCHEAAALAGHWQLGKLTWLYDANGVTLSGALQQSASENVGARFAALGWHVQHVEHGDTDLQGIDQALSAARRQPRRPSLIVVKTTIGFGAPAVAGSHRAHGAPLGPAAAKRFKAHFSLPPVGSFVASAPVRRHLAGVRRQGAAHKRAHRLLLASYRRLEPALHAEYQALHAKGPAAAGTLAPAEPVFDEPVLSTREASGRCLRALADSWPALVGGDGDLAPSTYSTVPGMHRHIAYGVREHAMGAISNGLAAHGSANPIAATFLAFSDYLRPALRMAALDGLGGVWLFTHDSVAVGEDGPTHQPVEQLMGLRLLPRLTVLRPADAHETWAAWLLVRKRLAHGAGPHALVLARQAVPVLMAQPPVHRGAYVLAPERGPTPDVVLLATGSEVHLACQAQTRLRALGCDGRVVSMPSWEVFAEQPAAYQNAVLGPPDGARVAVEAGVPAGWERWVGPAGEIVGVRDFGVSAPGPQALAAAHMTCQAVVDAACRARRRAGDRAVTGLLCRADPNPSEDARL